MHSFRHLAFAALAAGIVAGALLGAVQHFAVTPLILAAECFEHGAAETGQWLPQDGLERELYTTLFDMFAGFGFALLIAAGIYWHGKGGVWRGLAWGVAGYTAFFLAPGLGLPPELPGTESAALPLRQAWWLATVACSAAGLACLAFGKTFGWRIAGILLLALPHLVGAPQPEHAFSAAPEQLQYSFIIATSLANAAFWLALGVLTGRLLKTSGAL